MFCLIMSCYSRFGVFRVGKRKKYEALLIKEMLFIYFFYLYTLFAILNHLECVVVPLRPGSPFLASEDRVLGGVIVLRCCRCVEAQPSQNLQGILGKVLMIS